MVMLRADSKPLILCPAGFRLRGLDPSLSHCEEVADYRLVGYSESDRFDNGERAGTGTDTGFAADVPACETNDQMSAVFVGEFGSSVRMGYLWTV